MEAPAPKNTNPIITTISELFEYEKDLRKGGENNLKYIQVTHLLWLIIILPALLSISVAVFSYLWNQQWLYTTSITALLLSYLGAILYPFISAWIFRESIKKIIKNPLIPQLNIAATCINADILFLTILGKNPLLDLEIAYLEIKVERDSFEKRVGIVVGAIDKLGIAPGLLAALISLQKLIPAGSLQLKDQPFEYQLIFILSFALPLLYIMGATAHMSIMKLDRTLKILELVITRKKNRMNSPIRQERATRKK
ncbi:MAG: hypothetical protein V4732_22070 [Pseudomonadota bacterium]